jgi:hypothetical protein
MNDNVVREAEDRNFQQKPKRPHKTKARTYPAMELPKLRDVLPGKPTSDGRIYQPSYSLNPKATGTNRVR